MLNERRAFALVATLALAAPLACNKRTYGEGFGRPAHEIPGPVTPTAVGDVVLTEVFLGLDGSAPWVELNNVGGDTASLESAALCTGSACYLFPPGAAVAAGATVLFFPSGAPSVDAPAGAVAPQDGDLVGGASGSALVGELTLVELGAGSFVEPERLVAFVRLGVVPTTALTDRAVAAGLWPGVNVAAPLPEWPADSLTLLADVAAGPDAWVPALPTPRAANPTSLDVWSGCSFTDPALPTPADDDLALAEVSRADYGSHTALWVTLASRAGSVSLASYSLRVEASGGVEELALSGSIDAGALLARLVSVGCVGPECLVPVAEVESEGGSVTLLRALDPGPGTAAVQFIAWGESADAAQLDAAVAGGVWPASHCRLGSLAVDEAWTLDLERNGRAPSDYH